MSELTRVMFVGGIRFHRATMTADEIEACNAIKPHVMLEREWGWLMADRHVVSLDLNISTPTERANLPTLIEILRSAT
jgi:hypothetical protein